MFWKNPRLLAANTNALERARLALSREGRIPNFSGKDSFDRHSQELPVSKRIAQALNAEGRVAEKENRIDDAIKSHLDVARLHEKMRGGVMIDEMIGIAVENIGVGSLQKLSDQMTVNHRRDLVKELTRLYQNRDSYDEIMANEKRFVNSYGLKEQFLHLATFLSRRNVERKFQAKMKHARARLGLFLIDLSVHNFEVENGRPPNTLQELVPTYLGFLPKDDFNGKDFVYRIQSNSFQLYSVGFDGVDDGGKPLSDRTTEAKGDILSHALF